MNNHQCFCYGVIALHNLLKYTIPLNSDTFYNEMYNLWDIYSCTAIQQLYFDMQEKEDF